MWGQYWQLHYARENSCPVGVLLGFDWLTKWPEMLKPKTEFCKVVMHQARFKFPSFMVSGSVYNVASNV